ncbi:CRISPR-associated helicase Cas3' [Geodermatophilus sp. SYSU D00691]
MWAHSMNRDGHRHALADHLRGTAEFARRFAEPFGAGELAYVLGLLHDAGKASCEWQARLLEVEGTEARAGLPHKQLGAWLAYPRAKHAAGAILAHHGGLLDRGDVAEELRLERARESQTAATVQRLRDLLPEVEGGGEGPALIPRAWSSAGNDRVLEMGLRMVFSALVDADHLDTAAHFAGSAAPGTSSPADFGDLVEVFEKRRAELLAGRRPSPVDDVRLELYAAAVAAAAGPSGIYRLPAPTGAGKTLASAGFALHHAARWAKERVIIAVPYLTITEQNAQVYRQLLGDELVLEHHSGIDPEDGSPARRWQGLAAENWDAPFVVTTTVQLFDSLFGRKPARSRKVHRLANAVLVLDEVQALPDRLLPPILDGLRVLSEHFGTTVLLTSATQPEFQHLQTFPPDSVVIREVVPDPAPMYARMRRVVYEWRTDPRPTFAQLADEIAKMPQALIVLNTTADARRMQRLLGERRGDDVRHLSTRMCGSHRREVLESVLAELQADRPVVLVSTQLIEAGVDVDFPVVVRALAPADSLQQAAGRANREGRRPENGRVIIVDPVDSSQPPDYRTRVALTKKFFGPGRADPDNRTALAAYYRSLCDTLNIDEAEPARSIQRHRSQLNFQTVADGPLRDVGGDLGRDLSRAFRMLPDETVQLVVRWDTTGVVDALVAEVRSGTAPRRDMLRALQPYLVSLPIPVADRPEVRAVSEELLDGLRLWRGHYDPVVGIDETVLDPSVS